MIWLDKIRFYKKLLKHEDTKIEAQSLNIHVSNETLNPRIKFVWNMFRNRVEVFRDGEYCCYDSTIIDEYYYYKFCRICKKKEKSEERERLKNIFGN